MSRSRDEAEHTSLRAEVRIVTIEALLTPEQVADILNVKVSQVNEWRYKGIYLPYVKVGRFPRYKVEDVEEYMQKHRCTPSTSSWSR